MITPPTAFHPLNTATQLLQKIGSGTTDADFARAVHMAVDRAGQTKKKAKVVLTVEIDPRDDTGSLVLRALVETQLPKLTPPSTQMHIGPEGELLTQLEFLMGGGPSETPRPIPQATATSASGRHVALAAPPAVAPITDAPKPSSLSGGGPAKA